MEDAPRPFPLGFHASYWSELPQQHPSVPLLSLSDYRSGARHRFHIASQLVQVRAGCWGKIGRVQRPVSSVSWAGDHWEPVTDHSHLTQAGNLAHLPSGSGLSHKRSWHTVICDYSAAEYLLKIWQSLTGRGRDDLLIRAHCLSVLAAVLSPKGFECLVVIGEHHYAVPYRRYSA